MWAKYSDQYEISSNLSFVMPFKIEEEEDI